MFGKYDEFAAAFVAAEKEEKQWTRVKQID